MIVLNLEVVVTVDVLAQSDLDLKIGAPDKDTGSKRTGVYIRDLRFAKAMRRLRVLRLFQTHEPEGHTIEMPVFFGGLLQLRYAPWGRLPSKKEWAEVDRLTFVLFGRLTDPLKKKFARSQVSRFITYVPLLLMVIACISLMVTVNDLANLQWRINYNHFITDPKQLSKVTEIEKLEKLDWQELSAVSKAYRQYFLEDARQNDVSYSQLMVVANSDDANWKFTLYYLIWLICMGSIGAVAYIGMNAISAQDDLTFDMSNQRLTILRVALGGLFALVLTLPFGSESFIDFCYFVSTGHNLAAAASGAITSQTGTAGNSFGRVLMLTAPFLLGFSTSLVILILNQLIDGIQSFFGKRAEAARYGQPGPGRAAPTRESGSAATTPAVALLPLPTPTS
jgi:hypothetical protein